MPMLRATADVAGASVYLGLLRLTNVPSRSAEFVMDSLEVADAIMLRLMQRERVSGFAGSLVFRAV